LPRKKFTDVRCISLKCRPTPHSEKGNGKEGNKDSKYEQEYKASTFEQERKIIIHLYDLVLYFTEI
jgi:hypothetical protein